MTLLPPRKIAEFMLKCGNKNQGYLFVKSKELRPRLP